MSNGEPIAPGGGLEADTRVSGAASAEAQAPAAEARPGGDRIGATDATLRASGRAGTSSTPSDHAATLAIGSRLDRYVVLGHLGAGGMGEVFSGYDEELDRRVALKITRSQVLGESERQGRMRREAQALARLSHPNVVQIHDVGELDGQLFIAMEHVKGETLRDWQSRLDPRLPAQRQAILDMYAQAGRGLAAAHAVGIIHRDFKPKSRRPSQTAPQPTDRPHSHELGRFERVSLLRLAPRCPGLPQVLAKGWQRSSPSEFNDNRAA